MAFNRDEVTLMFGKTLAYSDTQGGTYTTVDGTMEIQLPQRELGEDEITNDASASYHRDYIPGLYEPGEATFTYKYTRTVFAALETIFQLASVSGTRADAIKWWKVTLPDASTAVFQGFLKTHDLPTELDTSGVVEGSIRVIGKMTFTAGSSGE